MKPLYGHQEGAEVGYNPHKPGRPSHSLHTYVMANLRLVLDVEVRGGKQHGRGTYKLPSGYEYTGDWVEGEILGISRNTVS